MRVGVVAALVLSAQLALADGDPPWSVGVTAEHRDAAQHLLDEGNEQLLGNHYKEALASYRDAIALWDHPAIRFNMVRALIALDRFVDAADNLDKALAYGQGPLTDDVYREAISYQHLLASSIATLEIHCDQPGVEVAVDGVRALDCPGTTTQRATPGAHAVTAAKPGHMPRTWSLSLSPGKPTRVDAQLEKMVAPVARDPHRWALWKPWSVAVGGVALVAAGGILEAAASSSFAAYDGRVASGCGGTTCSTNDPTLTSDNSRGKLENELAVAAWIAGGAALATGIVLIGLDRPREMPLVAPVATPGGGGAVVVGHF
jgi:hypothetical protein